MLTKLTNGEKREYLGKLKLIMKLLFSPEIYEELADEFQAQADAKRAQRQRQQNNHTAPDDPLIPGYTHVEEKSE